MACAHAKFTGEVGVCLATSGPGRDPPAQRPLRREARPPAGAWRSSASRRGPALGGNYQQEVDLPVAVQGRRARVRARWRWCPRRSATSIDRAMPDRAAPSARSPRSSSPTTCRSRRGRRRRRTSTARSTRAPAISGRASCPTDERPRPRRRGAERRRAVAMLVGQGALHAADEVVEVADVLGAGVAKALLGKAVLPDDLPYVTGSIGLLGTKPSWTLMQECDTLLMVGSSFPYSEFLPEEGQARGVQIDIDGRMLGIRYPMEVNLVGDSAETLRALLPRLERKEDRSWREQIEGEVAEWWKLMEERAQLAADPINPQLVFHELSKRLPDGAILTSDSGSSANWYARDVKLREGMMASLSGTLATMGPGVPVRDRRQVRPSRPAGDRAGRRRRDADERHQRADHDRQVPRPVGRPAADRAGAQQPRPQPGDLGAAGDGGRPEVRGLAGPARLPVRRYAELLGLQGHPRRRTRSRSARPGTRRWAPTARSCSRRSPIPRCRRCRRTSRSSRPRRSARRCWPATRTPGGSSGSRSSRRSRSSCPGR